jgi:hypothetical protein
VRAVVNVSTGEFYLSQQERLQRLIPNEQLMFWREFPAGWPTHGETPYAFKAFAIREAEEKGFGTILWMDSSVVPLRPLEPLWNLIERQGYWFSNNPPHNCGEWTCDSALAPLGITREEAFGIPHVIATAFGLDFGHAVAREFFNRFLESAVRGSAFRGPWNNDDGAASKDPRVRGHRHDQTVASILAYRLGMKLTQPPRWIVDGSFGTEETVLSIHR